MQSICKQAANVASTLEKQAEDKRLAEDAHRQQQAPGLAPQRSVAAAGLAAAGRTACYAAQLAQVILQAVKTPIALFDARLDTYMVRRCGGFGCSCAHGVLCGPAGPGASRSCRYPKAIH